ncbi:MAG: hypothetical protein M9922_07025 [Microthrixaceae bacterium]|nr:hypothetical protein [Microthrixaceae bacterium]
MVVVEKAAPPARSVRIAGRELPVVFPKWSDPRLHLALVITTVQVLGQVVFGFDLSITQILVSVGVCAALELVIVLWKRRELVWPASAMVTGNGVALILRVPGTEHGDWWSTRGWWAFASIAGLSVLSKYVVRWNGRHIFNPSNLGLVVGVVAFRVSPIGRMNELQVDLQDLWWGPMSIGMVLTLVVIGVGGRGDYPPTGHAGDGSHVLGRLRRGCCGGRGRGALHPGPLAHRSPLRLGALAHSRDLA